MPYARPTLSDLKGQVAADIQAGLPGSDALLRFSSLKTLGTALAGLGQLQYGYTDWVARMANPFTAEDEYLEAWAALKNVFRKAATQAGALSPGQVSFSDPSNVPIPAGTPLVRGDGIGFTTTADAVVSGGVAVVDAVANADPSGLTGAFGNCPVGTSMTLGTAIAGVQSTGSVTAAFTGGADVESDDSLRTRMLQAYQNVPQGGAVKDYITWALQVAGVTRAWAKGSGFGAGTVVVYTMFDLTESANNGFPQGVSGVATLEIRGTPTATEDLLEVADWIYPLRPATALIYSVAPNPDAIDFTISGIATASAATKAAISMAIAGILVLYGSPLSTVAGQNGVIALSFIESAIAAIPGTTGFVITSPTGNIVGTTGQLPVLGAVNYTA